jgi:DNA topoisomerase-3
LPGIARGGTTLVISPLISLIEDQVAALRAKGFAAERIHSGRDRATSRRVCTDYLEGRLQFLFIAPERLRVQGFPEMLAKRKPALIAIDEAHCISQWGHDFRPDYRRIGPHLPAFRPAPVIALTATATEVVQNDIVVQLGLPRVKKFIHGFRRDNIAIEVVEVAPSARLNMVRQILAQPGRRPAIVYTPTRREAESVARAIGALPYHAGMDPKRRDDIQAAFLGDEVNTIVATIAFGMGIDKPDVRTVIHTGLPGSLEGYYQEIGRAGRDGAPSRAILMQAYSDRRTHDYFFERDYPEPDVLAAIFNLLSSEPRQHDDVLKAARMDEESFAAALDKLAIHGGAEVDSAGNLTRGTGEWRPSYEEQCERKQAQLRDVLRFTECNQCRMVKLVRHFGDLAGAREPCGICDYCAGDDTIAQQFRPASRAEREMARETVNALRAVGVTSSGRLFKQLANGPERHTFERMLAGLARAGLIEMADAVFETEGREIPYKRVALTAAGRALEPEAPVEFDVTAGVAAPQKVRKKKSKRARRRD